MDHIFRTGVFVAAADAGGFTGAAYTLSITNSAVSKQIQNLEVDLKVKSDAGYMLRNAAIEGVGMAVLSIFYVAEQRENGRLPSRFLVDPTLGSKYPLSSVA